MTAITVAMTACFPAGGAAYDETVTIATSSYCQDGTTDVYFDFGHPNSGSSLSGTTYTDGSSTTRTVTRILWEEVGAGSCVGGYLYLRLDTASVPNTDNTFTEIEYAGTTYTRGSATYTASTGGDTQWRWTETSGTGKTGSSANLKIFI